MYMYVVLGFKMTEQFQDLEVKKQDNLITRLKQYVDFLDLRIEQEYVSIAALKRDEEAFGISQGYTHTARISEIREAICAFEQARNELYEAFPELKEIYGGN